MAQIVTITNPLTGQPAQVDQLDHTAQQIDDAIARALPGGAIDSVLSSKPNPNLLDNWYFGNPVNQRGQTSYTGAGYGIDRWATQPAQKLLVEENCVTIITGTEGYHQFIQKFENGTLLSGKTVTMSVLLETGLYSGSFVFPSWSGEGAYTPAYDDGSDFFFGIWYGSDTDIQATISTPFGSTIKFKAAKLELGTTQTLAHQENGVWVLNEIPDYGEQLARCQRYQFEAFDRTITGQGYLAHVKATNSTTAYGLFLTPVTMREGGIPSLVTDCSATNPYNAFGIYADGYSNRKGVITEISVYSRTQNGVILKATGSNFVAGNDYYIFVTSQNTHQFLLDRNL